MGNTFKKKGKSSEDVAIELFVKRLLENKSINIKCLPDSIEEKIYISMLQVLMGNLKEFSKTFKVELFNYNITINIDPIINKDESSENQREIMGTNQN
jgi:hypothetical protein